ncbi:Catabolic 3-dehydroquinase [Cytospora mali]|uniref:Catabolic 3-dehydroquinase n=1 Tax=Cytospora mali TaxID=578113 RepID=A0A194V6T3_CYTMA|nr:Catabolic 3-dehydroquinase [Valsa mali var. pyri (nom. inval.)]
MPRRILLINGPNLNLLGTREPHIYGSTTLSDVTASAQSQAQSLGITLETFQSNHEGAIVDRIQEAAGFFSSAHGGSQSQSGKQDGNRKEKVSAIIINPGAYTHTSVAIRDALLGVEIPFVEVHVSNVHAREPFRKHSYLSDKAVAVIAGLGVYGYQVALEFAARHMKLRDEE